MRLLLLVATWVAVVAARTLAPFDMSISAADPVVQFAPIGNRTSDTQGHSDSANTPTGAASVTDNGWELSYSGVDLPAANVTYTTLGKGTPKRSTKTVGATITLKWVGTGIRFYGNTTDATGIGISVDGFPTNVNNTNSVLGGIDNLPYRQHQAVLTVNSGTLDFYSATITTALETDGPDANAANVTEVSTVAGADKQINPLFVATSTNGAAWAGRWDWAGTAWDHVGTTGQGATLAYSVPANTSYLALYGGTSGWNGDYRISFSPPVQNEATGYRGSEYNTWRGQDVLLWAGPLDPAQKYDMTLETLLFNWWIDVSKVKVWSALYGDETPTNATAPGNGTTPDSNDSSKTKGSTNVGPIVGGVVGGVVALILLALLVWFLRRRRNRTRSPLDILDSDTSMAYEYKDQTHVAVQERNVPKPPDQFRAAPFEDEDAVLLSPFPHSPFPHSSAGPSTSPSGTAPVMSSYSKQTHNAQPRPREITRQETDAGAVVVNVVPPSYDPSWSMGGGGGEPSSSHP